MKGFTTLLAAAGLMACAQGAAFDLTSRTIPARGGWSLQMDLTDTCPSGTSTCFSNLTGVYSSTERTGVDAMFNRGNECCPEGTTPRLDCGTYVNVGQPYACCPLDNPDCRGDVESPSRNGTEQCANTGWALWYIPDGDYNKFCCLPDHYGYWYKSLGQDAVGMCSKTPVLPENSTPGVQVNNGDGSVSANGTQLISLPVPAATPAPTCDIVHYGWSLQVDDAAGCTDESNYCSYGGSCCPKGLSCGTVIGDSEVPVCCPPGNPDCRGDVEGLWPQVCADSSWALWHVNTNGNHFCCQPDQIGFNVPGNNSAVGFCGDAVPHGYMRSILDYVGDGSKPGSFAEFPCDSVPAPNASFSSIESAILHPAPTLNPVATNLWSNWSSPAVATIVKPWLETVYVCPPGASQTVAVIHSLSSGIPVTATSTVTSVPSGAIITTGPLPTGTGSSSSGSGSGSGSSGSSGSGSGSGSSGSGSSGSGSSGSGSSGSGSSGSGSSGSGSSGSGSSGNGSSGSVGTGTSSSTPAVFTAGASFQSASLSVVLGLFAIMLWL